ncbi:MAG: hypothetical protein IJI15_03845 [Atopobiaceae bacterium]|nr:hypothetical protein [Atopobiaceae bacterium]
MDRLDAFERMLADIQDQAAYEAEQMDALRARGKEKTATYKQYVGNRLLFKAMLAKYRDYGLLDG